MQPLIKGEEGLKFAILSQARQVVGENFICQHSQRKAAFRGDVLLLIQMKNAHLESVIAPDFGHAECGVNRIVSGGAVMDVHFDHNIGRRINREVEMDPVPITEAVWT